MNNHNNVSKTSTASDIYNILNCYSCSFNENTFSLFFLFENYSQSLFIFNYKPINN